MTRVVVTGAKGGTGRSIVKVLRERGYDVVGIDLQPIERGDGKYVQLDVTTDPGLHDVLAGAAAVVHFGSLPTDAWTSRSAAFSNLIVGGFNIFQACANLAIPRVVYASSIMVYGDFRLHRYLPVDEDSPLQPDDIYSSSKAMLEMLAGNMCRWHPLSIAAFRLGRIVYEGRMVDRLLPHTKDKRSAMDVLWTYVDARDVAEACHLWIASSIQGFRIFNVAADDVCIDTRTKELLQEFYPGISERRQNFDAHQSPFSCEALKTSLGWQAQYNWRELCANG